MKNINEQYIEKILTNQRIYIKRFKKSLLGKMCCNIKDNDKNGIPKDEELILNKKNIRKINELKLKKIVQKNKEEISRLYYHLINLKKIKIEQNINKNKNKDYISIATIIKNEGENIKEWIEFHLIMGVNHFYIFDNESEDSTKKILQPYIENGIVTYIYYPGKKVQVHAFNDACRMSRERTEWLALLDADEFLFPIKNNKLNEFFKDYEKYPAVGVNWRVYGYRKKYKET